MKKLNKKIVFIICAVFLFIIIVFLFSILNPKLNVRLQTAPFDMMLKIDSLEDISIKNNQLIRLSTGEHSLLFHKDGFEDQIKKINISNENTIVDILVILNPISDRAKKLMDDNQEAFAPLYELNAHNSIEEYKKQIVAKYPIFNDLPIKTRTYVIDSCDSTIDTTSVSKLFLCVKTNNKEIDNSVIKQHLINLGYEPSSYEIIINYIEQ